MWDFSRFQRSNYVFWVANTLPSTQYLRSYETIDTPNPPTNWDGTNITAADRRNEYHNFIVSNLSDFSTTLVSNLGVAHNKNVIVTINVQNGVDDAVHTAPVHKNVLTNRSECYTFWRYALIRTVIVYKVVITTSTNNV